MARTGHRQAVASGFISPSPLVALHPTRAKLDLVRDGYALSSFAARLEPATDPRHATR